jgi:hypothetical protein
MCIYIYRGLSVPLWVTIYPDINPYPGGRMYSRILVPETLLERMKMEMDIRVQRIKVDLVRIKYV